MTKMKSRIGRLYTCLPGFFYELQCMLLFKSELRLSDRFRHSKTERIANLQPSAEREARNPDAGRAWTRKESGPVSSQSKLDRSRGW